MQKIRAILKFLLGFTAFICLAFLIYSNLDHSPSLTPTPPNPLSKEAGHKHVAEVIDRGTKVMANLITGKFSLTDHRGKRRTHLDFRGRITLVYFGYTFCPDICPQALSNITEALYELKDRARDINAIFISVDPERDQIRDLGRYMENFHPNFTALTGTSQEIEEAAHSFRVYFTKINDQSSSDYLMDHSSIIYVMDQRGRFVASFNHETPAKEIAVMLLKLL
jgi:protein SCO1/2